MATASNSLFKMSVISDASNPNQTLLMPKLQYRFRVLFLNFGDSSENSKELTRQVVDVTRPNVSFQKITLPVYNSTIYMAGKHTWNPVTVNIRDDSSGAVAAAVAAQLQRQMNFVEQASAGSASDYKFSMYIQILDGGNGTDSPAILETWELYGCYLESANYNNLAYSNSEDVKIGLTIQYDNAIQSTSLNVTGTSTS